MNPFLFQNNNCIHSSTVCAYDKCRFPINNNVSNIQQDSKSIVQGVYCSLDCIKLAVQQQDYDEQNARIQKNTGLTCEQLFSKTNGDFIKCLQTSCSETPTLSSAEYHKLYKDKPFLDILTNNSN